MLFIILSNSPLVSQHLNSSGLFHEKLIKISLNFQSRMFNSVSKSNFQIQLKNSTKLLNKETVKTHISISTNQF